MFLSHGFFFSSRTSLIDTIAKHLPTCDKNWIQPKRYDRSDDGSALRLANLLTFFGWENANYR